MRYIRLTLILILTFLLCSCKIYKKPERDYQLGLFSDKYPNVVCFVGEYSIVQEGELKYLYKNNDKIIDKGFDELLSVDVELIKEEITIKKDQLTYYFLGIDKKNYKVTIIKQDVVVKEVINAYEFIGITNEGFIIKNKLELYSYYDYKGNVLGNRYIGHNFDQYYENSSELHNIKVLKEGLGNGALMFKIDGSDKYDLFIGKTKILQIDNCIINWFNKTYIVKRDDSYTVFDLKGNVLYNNTKDIKIIDEKYAIMYDLELNKYYMLLDPNTKVYIDDKYYDKNISVYESTPDLIVLIVENDVLLLTKNKSYEFPNATYYKSYKFNGIYVFDTETDEIYFNYKGQEVYRFTDDVRIDDYRVSSSNEIFLDIGNRVLTHNALLLDDKQNKKTVYIYKDIVRVYDIDHEKEVLTFITPTILKYSYSDERVNNESVFNALKVRDIKDISKHNDAKIIKFYNNDLIGYYVIDNIVYIISLDNGESLFKINVPNELENVTFGIANLYEIKGDIHKYLISYYVDDINNSKSLYVSYDYKKKKIISKFLFDNYIIDGSDFEFFGVKNKNNKKYIYKLCDNGEVKELFGVNNTSMFINSYRENGNIIFIFYGDKKYLFINSKGKVKFTTNSIMFSEGSKIIIEREKYRYQIYDYEENEYYNIDSGLIKDYSGHFFLHYNDDKESYYLYDGKGEKVDTKSITSDTTLKNSYLYFNSKEDKYLLLDLKKFEVNDGEYYYFGINN